MEDSLLRDRRRSCWRRASRRCSVTLATLASVGITAQQAAAQCDRNPVDFAIDFFNRLEERQEPFTPKDYEVLFAERFRVKTSFPELVRAREEIFKRFGIDRRDRPLADRMTRPPEVDLADIGERNRATSVSISALSARGQLILRALLLCEQGEWKAIQFTYSPPEK